MKSQQTFILTLTVATIMTAAALQPARTNAQGAIAAMNLHRAHPVQAVVDGGHKASQEANATPLTSKVLPDFPGKEVVMMTVTYPPGHSGPVHKHNAHGFIYVLEGSVEMAVMAANPSHWGLGKHSMKAPMTFTRSAATRARRGRPNFWYS